MTPRRLMFRLGNAAFYARRASRLIDRATPDEARAILRNDSDHHRSLAKLAKIRRDA